MFFQNMGGFIKMVGDWGVAVVANVIQMLGETCTSLVTCLTHIDLLTFKTMYDVDNTCAITVKFVPNLESFRIDFDRI